MRLESEALRVRSELASLRSQLNPHFLFNALHSVTALVRLDPQKAQTALFSLSNMPDALLPTSVFRSLFISHSRKFVILNPRQ